MARSPTVSGNTMDTVCQVLNILLHLACVSIVVSHPVHLMEKRDIEEPYPPSFAEENLGVPGSDGIYIEGDIIVQRRRNAVSKFHLTWVNRSVPFVMDDLDLDKQLMVVRAMEEIMNKSCVRFVPRTKETDYIRVIPTGGCFSPVGRTGGSQSLYLADNCFYHGIIVHELMHALGFWHEHSRPDRDNYISIMWDNIAAGHRSNFEKYGRDKIDVLGTNYDYGSIMHYRNNTFAIDRSRITINHTKPLPAGVEMGQRIGLSDTDVLKIRRLYKCNITNCTDPGIPQHGSRVGNSTEVSAAVSYFCQPGYRLYGSRGRSCLDQGYWTGLLPSCLPDPSRSLEICNFDDHVNAPLCGWVIDHSDLPWTPRNRPTPSNNTGPDLDHTMGTEEGWYVYLEASDVRPGQHARLFSPELQSSPPGPSCMMFYYSMHGQDMGALNVYQQLPNSSFPPQSQPLFSMTGDQGAGWKLAAITLPSQATFQIMIDAEVGGGYHSDIAVDDIVIGPCSILQHVDPHTGADTFHCSFDTGWCGLEQDKHGDDFDWSRQAGETPSAETGPDCDPLDCNSGYYIYIESSRPRRMRDIAHLKTPLLHGEGNRCLEFWWHMFGTGMGNLTVKLRQLDGSEVAVWSQSNSHGNEWHFERVNMQISSRLYQLVFEGIVGPSYTSDAALDNIAVHTGQCQGVVQNDCTFEQNTCSWENVPDHLPWRRNHGSTPTPRTGPTVDHNNSSMGYYLYVESSRTFPNQTARLRSGQMAGNFTGYCLQFWYHMLGSDAGVLSVLLAPSPAGTERTLWHRSGAAGNVWHRQLLYFTSSEQPGFSLVFEARLVGGSGGDIAIDDVVVHAGQCDTPELSLH